MAIYNPEVKKAYIDHNLSISQTAVPEAQSKALENLFKRLGNIEEDFEVDIANADYETAMSMLSLLGRGGVKHNINMVCILKNYVNWCIDTGKICKTENVFDGISFKDIDKSAAYRISMVKDEQQLSEYLDVCFHDVSEDNIDIIYRTYALLVFNGIEPTLVQYLTPENVNFEEKTIVMNSIVIPMSKLVLGHLSDLNNIQYYVTGAGKKKNIRRLKANTGHLIEMTSTNREAINRYFIAAMSKAAKKYYEETQTKKSITSNGIYKSGIFYRAYMRELRGEDVNVDEYFKFDKAAQCPDNVALRTHHTKILTIEYVQWKKAFGL